MSTCRAALSSLSSSAPSSARHGLLLAAVLAAALPLSSAAQTAAPAAAPIAVAPATAAAPAPGTDAPKPPFSFFITSAGSGKGADLGGLAGADAHCQKLAEAAGSTKTWRAYLSTQATAGQPAVHARDRIGQGPWYNTRGAVVARNLSHLHGDTLDEARIGNAVSWSTAFTEKNEPVKRAGDKPNEHDILTGSQPDGRAFTEAEDRTCRNYTSSAEDGSVQVGHFDRTGGNSISWNSAHKSRGCSQAKLNASGGAGLFYCFAVN